jgi:hypothetical protein
LNGAHNFETRKQPQQYKTSNKNRMLDLLSFQKNSLADCLAHKPTKPSIRPEELLKLSNAYLIENDRRRTLDLSQKIHPRDSTARLSLAGVKWSGFPGAAHSAELLQERKQESERKKSRQQQQQEPQVLDGSRIDSPDKL